MKEHEERLLAALQGDVYRNYVYSYPHKTSYRDLPEPISLAQAWKQEDKSSLFLYLHIPFCEMRCGYCNLFTTTQATDDLVNRYLDQLVTQMRITNGFLGDYEFAQMAMGGGTPTYLSTPQLQKVFDSLKRYLHLKHIPTSVEVSPATIDAEKLACLSEYGVDRISIGVESFNAQDLKKLGRPQSLKQVSQALQLIRDSNLLRLNIDLIYGSANQSLESWLASVDEALQWQPEELFLYPLYVRPLTGLGKRSVYQQEDRMQFYEAARDKLLANGYQQSSMRMFVKQQSALTNEYRCQEDGMVGLGAGARSYTRNLHYSSNYAVNKQQIGKIIQDYIDTPDWHLAQVDYGIELDLEDQKRRYVLLSLLQCEGLNLHTYQQKFQSSIFDDFPELVLLEKQRLASSDSDYLILNEQGIAYSDVIGHWFFSNNIKSRMQDWEWK